MKVYLIGYFEDCKYPSEVLQELELIPEEKMVETVKDMISEGRIYSGTIEDNNYDITKLTVEMAIQILESDGWTVKEYEF